MWRQLVFLALTWNSLAKLEVLEDGPVLAHAQGTAPVLVLVLADFLLGAALGAVSCSLPSLGQCW